MPAEHQEEPPRSAWRRYGLSAAGAAVALSVILALFLYWAKTGTRQHTFTPVGSMNEPRMHHTSTDVSGNVLQGLFLIAGGEAESPHHSPELYDQGTRRFLPGASMLNSHS